MSPIEDIKRTLARYGFEEPFLSKVAKEEEAKLKVTYFRPNHEPSLMQLIIREVNLHGIDFVKQKTKKMSQDWVDAQITGDNH